MTTEKNVFKISDYDNVLEYVDPFPQLKGTDQVWRVCYSCNGSGRYYAPTSYYRNYVAYCFKCDGNGGTMVNVSTVRTSVKNKVKRNIEKQVQAIKRAEKHAAYLEEQAKIVEEKKQLQKVNETKLLDMAQEIPVGSLVKGTAKVSSIRGYIQKGWGYYDNSKSARVITFHMNDTNYVWFTASKKGFNLNLGDTVNFEAVIKKLDTFNDNIQVIITKVKFSVL